jgi:hypothetical protein
MKRLIAIATLVVAAGCGSAQTPMTTRVSGNRETLAQPEIQANRTAGMTAYDLIAHLRPEYLRNRGQNTLRETSTAAGPPTYTAPTATVYLDNAKYGDIESLKNINADIVQKIQYLSASNAMTRFGMDNTAGAILIFTK